MTRWQSGDPLRILAIRDELISRAFDEPGAWWPQLPGVIGGRDRAAGGSWCVSDVAAGATALVLNRPEQQSGTPSRGVLPLAALEHGDAWTEHVDHHAMATFTLVLAAPDGVRAWEWTGTELTRTDLTPGQHVFTSNGIDPDTPKGNRYAPLFAERDWVDVVTGEQPSDDLDALVIRHPVPDSDDVYGTVFGQLLETEPGKLAASFSRTPWVADDWSQLRLPQPVSDGHRVTDT